MLHSCIAALVQFWHSKLKCNLFIVSMTVSLISLQRSAILSISPHTYDAVHGTLLLLGTPFFPPLGCCMLPTAQINLTTKVGKIKHVLEHLASYARVTWCT